MRSIVAALWVAVGGALGLAACQGCHTSAPISAAGVSDAKQPTLRLYLLSTVAGGLEPCGCTKNQLGGVNHLAGFIAKERARAPNALVLAAGPMMFLEPKLPEEGAQQATWKAEAIAAAAKTFGLSTWAPGYNDWAGGRDELGKLGEMAGAPLSASNCANVPDASAPHVVEVGGVKVGVVGVAEPKDRSQQLADGVADSPPLAAMKKGIEEVKAKGARVLVGLAALPRGEALRLADENPELAVLVVGKSFEAGDANDSPKPPVLAGTTLVVEAANHLQTISVVDLFVRDGEGGGPLKFADADNVAKADEVLAVDKQIRELEAKITEWEKNPNVKKEDVEARRGDLAKLREQKAKLEEPSPPPPGSFFRYRNVEIRAELGSDPSVDQALTAYYKRVDDYNKEAFKDRKPPPVEKGKPYYVGVEECTTCHDEARKVWDKTDHAKAYPTLQKEFKEFNLDCVSCHVTGYGKPGGSTVTFNEKLQNVQCEECHGPGSIHAKTQKKEDVLIPKPTAESCVSTCHHPPHVESFDAKARMKLILGPGHGEKS